MLILPPHRSWILDLGASFHMIGIKDKSAPNIFSVNFLLLTLPMVQNLLSLVME